MKNAMYWFIAICMIYAIIWLLYFAWLGVEKVYKIVCSLIRRAK